MWQSLPPCRPRQCIPVCGYSPRPCPAETVELIQQRERRLGVQQEQIEEANKQFYLDECDKLDIYSDDLKEQLHFYGTK